ncbi:hypothetical protein ACLB2K_026941 [Fragaria x ananassa]
MLGTLGPAASSAPFGFWRMVQKNASEIKSFWSAVPLLNDAVFNCEVFTTAGWIMTSDPVIVTNGSASPDQPVEQWRAHFLKLMRKWYLILSGRSHVPQGMVNHYTSVLFTVHTVHIPPLASAYPVRDYEETAWGAITAWEAPTRAYEAPFT